MKSQLKIAKINYLGKRWFDLLLLSDKIASFLVFIEAQKFTLKQNLKRIPVTCFQKKILILARKRKGEKRNHMQTFSHVQ